MNTIKKTALDLRTPPPKEPKVYEANSIEELFDAIYEELTVNPKTETILLKVNSFLYSNLGYLDHDCGFETWGLLGKNIGYLRFKSYSKWVFFKDNVPVYFTDECAGTDHPPHNSVIKKGVYESLDFDRCEKIYFK
jgi:hypothetical protein